jgi:hypothetical protein
LKASLVRYRVDKYESLTSPHILLSHRRKLILNVVLEEEK